MRLPSLTKSTTKDQWTAFLFSGRPDLLHHACASLDVIFAQTELAGKSWEGREWFYKWMWGAFSSGQAAVLKELLSVVPIGSPFADECVKRMESRLAKDTESVNGWTADCLSLIGNHPAMLGIEASPGWFERSHRPEIYPPLLALAKYEKLDIFAYAACKQNHLPLAVAVADALRPRKDAIPVKLDGFYAKNFPEELARFRKVFGSVAPDVVAVFEKLVSPDATKPGSTESSSADRSS